MTSEVVHTSPTPLVERTVRFLTFEVADEAYAVSWGNEQPVLPTIPEPYASVLDGLEVDAHTCSACETRGVGFCLEGDADEICRWNWLTIAHDGSRTWMLCEECAQSLEPSGG